MTNTPQSTSWEWPAPEVGPVRDFVGYGRHTPSVRWPGDARVVVSLCLNYEEGSERSIAFGDSINEPNPEYVKSFPPGVRDLATESLFEYGSRVGVFRLLRMFDDLDIRCTAFACAVALAVNPEVAHWLVEAGHEICSHGLRWTELWTLSREEERQHVDEVPPLKQICHNAAPPDARSCPAGGMPGSEEAVLCSLVKSNVPVMPTNAASAGASMTM